MALFLSILFDGTETDIFNFTYAPAPAAAYASYICDKDQLPGACDITFEVNVSTVSSVSLALPVLVKDCLKKECSNLNNCEHNLQNVQVQLQKYNYFTKNVR